LRKSAFASGFERVVGCAGSGGPSYPTTEVCLMQTAKMNPLPDSSVLHSIHDSIHALELEHGLYKQRLGLLREKAFLTEEEKLEEVRLKKMKLHLKDEMERLRREQLSYTQHS
jgi:hypothetical protein